MGSPFETASRLMCKHASQLPGVGLALLKPVAVEYPAQIFAASAVEEDHGLRHWVLELCRAGSFQEALPPAVRPSLQPTRYPATCRTSPTSSTTRTDWPKLGEPHLSRVADHSPWATVLALRTASLSRDCVRPRYDPRRKNDAD